MGETVSKIPCLCHNVCLPFSESHCPTAGKQCMNAYWKASQGKNSTEVASKSSDLRAIIYFWCDKPSFTHEGSEDMVNPASGRAGFKPKPLASLFTVDRLSPTFSRCQSSHLNSQQEACCELLLSFSQLS